VIKKVFKEEIRDMLEVYMDDMIAKSTVEVEHETHLNAIFDKEQKNNMRLNPKKCTFVCQSKEVHRILPHRTRH
jgi:uncharacterized protein (UPF0262 family)